MELRKVLHKECRNARMQVVNCNKPIFQKCCKSRFQTLDDIRSYVEISKSMSEYNKVMFLEKDCNIDYDNVVRYLDVVEQFEKNYNKRAMNFKGHLIYMFTIVIMALFTILNLAVHPT